MSGSSFLSSGLESPLVMSTAASNSGRFSSDFLPLISAEFIEDILPGNSDSTKVHDAKGTSLSEKCIKSLLEVSSPSYANNDRRCADQLFNYFFNKIENAETMNNSAKLCEERRTENSAHSTAREARKSGEGHIRSFSVVEEETMVSAVSSSESSCCSPEETPNYAATPSRRPFDSFDSKVDDSELGSVLQDWEPAGDPIRIEVVNQADDSLNVRASYSVMRHRVTKTVVRVGDAILMRDPNQQWFDRLPRVTEVLKMYQDIPVESSASPCPNFELHISLRRYYRSNQLLCAVPGIAVDMVSPDAVVFSSSHVETYKPASEFVGPCLLLSLNAFYRFWAEITRIRCGRPRRRQVMPPDAPENWQDWLENPDRVFVICGEYDFIAKDVEVATEPNLG